MDGFTVSKHPVVVIAGTNRSEVLDKALLRPGRFDRIIALELPDIKARKDILMVHLPKLKLRSGPEEYVQKIASMTPDFLARILLISARGCHGRCSSRRGLLRNRTLRNRHRKSNRRSAKKDHHDDLFRKEDGLLPRSWSHNRRLVLKHGSPLLKVSIVLADVALYTPCTSRKNKTSIPKN